MKKKLMNFVSNINNPLIKKTLKKLASEKQISLYQFNDLIAKNLSFAIYSNSEKASNLINEGIKNKILVENIPVIVYNSHIPTLSTNNHDLDKFDFSTIELVFCNDVAKPDASDLESLYQKISQQNPTITLMDNTAFPENHSDRLFKFRGLTYSIDSKTVLPTHFIVDFYIDELNKLVESFGKKIKMLDMCAGQGCIGLSVLNESKNIQNLFLVDINKFEIDQMKKTLQINNFSNVDVFHSNIFEDVPEQSQFHLISCNPPHFDVDDNQKITNLQRADKNWEFHRNFLGKVTNFLKSGGIVTLIENKEGSSIETFEEMFPKNLKIIDIKDVVNTQFYIIYAQKL